MPSAALLRIAALATLVVLPLAATPLPAQFPSSITTTSAGGATGDGVMFDIQNLSTGTITLFWLTQTFATPGTCPGFEVWVTAPGFVPVAQNPQAWTLVGSSGPFPHGGVGSATLVPILLDLSIPPGTSIGLYLTTTGGDAVAFTPGVAVGLPAAGNADLVLGQGRRMNYPFSGPGPVAIWNGTLSYAKKEGNSLTASINLQGSCSQVPKRVHKGLPHTVTGTESGASGQVTWDWAFSGPSGNHSFSPAGSVNYTWTALGTHFVAAQAEDSAGQVDYTLEKVEVCEEIDFHYDGFFLWIAPPRPSSVPGTTSGLTFFDLPPSGASPPGSGPFLGLGFGPLVIAALQSPPAVGDLLHFIPSPTTYPEIPYVIPVPAISGLTIDMVVAYLGAGNSVRHLTGVARLVIP